jgi:hypothetical protein
MNFRPKQTNECIGALDIVKKDMGAGGAIFELYIALKSNLT